METVDCVSTEIRAKLESEGSIFLRCRGVLLRTRWQIPRFRGMESL